jgi:hypothetical protein
MRSSSWHELVWAWVLDTAFILVREFLCEREICRKNHRDRSKVGV